MRYGCKPRRLGRDTAAQERKGGLVKTMARLKLQRGLLRQNGTCAPTT
jgi:hypothetical protein